MEGMKKMEIIKVVAILVYLAVCLGIIVLTFLQSKQSAGASGTIIGGESTEHGNFYEKNKGRTKEGKMMRWTVILVIIFAILSIALGIFLEFIK